VNCDSLPSRHVADDGIALDGIAALGAVDHHVVKTVDLDDRVVVLTLTGRGLFDDGRRRRLFHNLLGHRLLQHLACGELAVAERGVKVLDLSHAIFGRNAFEVVLLDARELHAEPAGFLFEILLADLDGALALIGVDDVLDFIARAGSFDDRKPVLAGKVAGLRKDVDNVAVAEHVAQRHDASVDLRTDAGIAHLRVHRIGEVDGT